MRLWVWRSFGIEVPEDWEMLQYSKNSDAGSVAFADRYRFRLAFSWRALQAAPDIERMTGDYCAKLRLEEPDGDAHRITAAGWSGVQSGRGKGSSRFARFYRGEGCLAELVFTWPGDRDRKLERAVLQSVRVVGERPGGLRRWKAFGMDMLVSKGMALREVKVEPALAMMAFSGETSGGSVEPKGCFREERFERLGMTSEWLRRPVAEWLASRAPEGFVLESRESRDAPGHTVETVRGTRRSPGMGRLLGRRRRREAAAWICPGDERLYYVHAEVAETRREAPEQSLVAGRLSCCPGVPLAGGI